MWRKETNGLLLGWMLILGMIITGCGTGYQIHQADGVETLYHVDGKGGKRIVYIVNEAGDLTVHDENDPLIVQFLSEIRLNTELALLSDNPDPVKAAHHTRLKTQQLIRLGRIKAAKKRGTSDPIHVTPHDPELGPAVSRRIGSVNKTKTLFKQFVADVMNADRIIHLTTHRADVDVYFKTYLKETAALDVKTHKIISIKAFHFEALVQSNFDTEDRQTIKGLGHWMEYQEVIKRTIHRVNQFIKEEIGSTIPKERESFLSKKMPRI